MALMECPECGREVSDKASACPGCGAPVVLVTQPTSEPVEEEPDPFWGARETPRPASDSGAPRPVAPSSALGIVGIVLGVASMVMPYFAAVFLVPAAFICGLISFLRGRRGLGFAAMLFAAFGLAGVILVSQQISAIVKDPFAPNAVTGSGSAPVVTMAEYERVTEGMSYEDVAGIIGDSGQEMSRSDVSGYSTVMYSWSNDNGSNMNAMFQNGKLVNKAQAGLR